jgi:methionyl-tRNA formyltransferase
MPRLRVVFFGTPSRFSQLAFEQLTVTQTLVALVLPESAKANLRRSLRGLVGLRTVSPLEKIARDLGIPVMSVSDELGGASSERLRALRPELICIALFPRILPLEIIGIAPLGAVNVHPSLLPPSRAPAPLLDLP